MDIVHRASLKDKVRDFHSWLTAFTWYLRAVTHFYPHLLDDLIRYQGIVASFAGMYAAPAWLAYDRNFRQHVANNPSISWFRIDEELFSIHLRGAAARNSCFSCSGSGHVASQCPVSSAGYHASSSSASSPSLSTGPLRRAPLMPPRCPPRCPHDRPPCTVTATTTGGMRFGHRMSVQPHLHALPGTTLLCRLPEER